MNVDKYYLFNFIPLFYRIEDDNVVNWKLFKFITVFRKETKEKQSIIKILGIPVIKVKSTNFNNDISYKILKLLSKFPIKRDKVILVDNAFEAKANIMDNYTLFQYLYDSPKKKIVPYYIINKKSPYYKKLKQKYKSHIIPWTGNCDLKFKLKMFILMPRLKYFCDSFQVITSFKIKLNEIIKKSPFIFSIFTQHGITYFKPDFILPNIYGCNIFDKVMVSNDFEKEIFINNGGFKEEQIIKNGLFRWDKIQDESVNQKEKSIFVYFTKRDYLTKVKNIKDCTYIKTIIDILTDSKLQSFTQANDIKLKIGLHHTISSKVKDIFMENGIEIVSEDDIAEVKTTASLILTDYSSMCFEFFLQNKPVIFYNINDIEECKLYGTTADVIEPYNNKEKILFNIALNKEDAVELIIKYINNKFVSERDIVFKQDKFFYYKKDFCKRFEDYLIFHLFDKKESFDE